MERDETTLLDIAKASRAAMEFVEGFSKEAFLDDPRTKAAVLYELIVVGEAVKRLSAVFRDQHPEIPWALIAGMRDHLIYGYDALDWDEVWKTATADVPALLKAIESMLPKRNGP
jgi:uncharacterized protein with HEPN domain